jgi:hypothetical protein
MAEHNWGSTMRSLGTTNFDGALTAQLDSQVRRVVGKLSMIPFMQELSNAWPCRAARKVGWAQLRPGAI